MSQEDYWKALGRCQDDLVFAAQVKNNPERHLLDAGFSLEKPELNRFKELVLFNPETESHFGSGPILQSLAGGDPLSMRERHDFMIRSMNLRISLTEKALDVVKQTFDRAAGTFSTITWMNRIMFGVGIALFVYAAVLATLKDKQFYSLLFGGLGAASFITLFLTDPIQRIQRALANLVQVQVVFMTYFDQVSWWEGLANIPKDNMPDPERIERASAGLQQRTMETLELMQRFAEEGKRPNRTKKDRDPQKHPAVHAAAADPARGGQAP